MMKRLIACLALLLCLAATAMAGGTEVSETVEYFNKGDFASIPGVYTYGGSKRDWIHDMAIAPNGRIAITGYTESSDGTLSDRTKTWRAGWVMMLDQNMNVMWNFCSRSGDLDHMHEPVFHEDGTISVAHETEGKQIKIVTLNADGEEIRSKTVVSSNGGDGSFSVRGATAQGYLLAMSETYADKASYALYDWDGNRIQTYGNDAALSVTGEHHMIAQDSRGLWLCALDEDGARRDVAKLSDLDEDGNADRSYWEIISLEDGGAAACGYIDEGKNSKGLISCWDARGNLVFEMIMPGNPLLDMVKTPTGYAAVRIANTVDLSGIWEVMTFDEKGLLTGVRKLEMTQSAGSGAPLGVRADGSIACAQLVGEPGNEDVIVTVLEGE